MTWTLASSETGLVLLFGFCLFLLLGSGNDSGVKLHNSFVFLQRERWGYGVPLVIFLGGIIC